MGLGRPSSQKEKLIRQMILNSVPSESPGATFSEIVQVSKRSLGTSRPTVWRYLDTFTRMKLILHEGKFYRKNPLIADLPSEELDHLGHLRSQSIEFWGPQKSWRADPIDTPDQLYDFFQKTIRNVVWGYVELLHAITTMPNLPAARELANLMIDSHVNWFLMLMAREVWDKRTRVPLNSLSGKHVSAVSYTDHRRRKSMGNETTR